VTPAERSRRGGQLEPDLAWMQGVLSPFVKANAHIDRVSAVPLAGGVSSDIYRVEVGGTTLCVKRALEKLKVAADWRAPVGRNRTEAAWLRFAAKVVPDAVPAILSEDPSAGAFAMEWLPPDQYPVWKHLLRDGVIVTSTARQVGDILGRLHTASARDPALRRTFATDAAFHAIRLDPYLLATARAHPDLAQRLIGLAERTANTPYALVHGDMSPKNLLIGPKGPVIVDAECAWWGDPAFDLAFVLNHLLLKGAWRPQWRARYVDLYGVLIDAYRAHVDWEPWEALEYRTATLLPALMLARIDGKSPVEYLVDDAARDAVREFARGLLTEGAVSIGEIAARWKQ
jgi:aminoglycoside phosphotransferase (APT) family kinase protein